MNKLVLKYALERNLDVVGVVGHHNIGEDAGLVAGI